MNLAFAKEVGVVRYVVKRVLWRSPFRPASIRLVSGVEFLLPPGNSFASDVYVTGGLVDWGAEQILLAFLREHGAGRAFWDVGAHIGYYGAVVAPAVESILFFEPDPRNHAHLEATAAALGKAEILPVAVADRAGDMFLDPANGSDVGFLSETCGIPVKVVTLDSVAAERRVPPAAIKIDIEGFDILALEGAVGVLRDHCPVVLAEFNLCEGRPNSTERLAAFCEAESMELHTIERQERGGGYRSWLRRIDPRTLGGCLTKMSFVVPKAHVSWFEGFAELHPHWDHPRDLSV